jgi:cellobiose-specific phosphotransferase system component IIC
MVCLDRWRGCNFGAWSALFLTSKSAYLKELGKIGFLPGLFNINEPIIFGAPIVMNPTLDDSIYLCRQW